MNSEEKEVFRKIAGCSIANRIIDDLEARNPVDEPYKSCETICLHQKEKFDDLRNEQVGFSKETFHMPEPWNGSLSTAEILFVSSNPSFDINETTPELARKENKEVLPKIISDPEEDDPETKRALEEAENFFEKRITIEKHDSPTRKKILKNPTWRMIIKLAGYLLKETRSVEPLGNIDDDQKRSIASQIALTEVVHCKSTGEDGVEEAVKECYGKHTRAVIELFLKSSPEKRKKVVVMGKPAQHAFAQGILSESLKADDPEISTDKLEVELENLGKELDKLRREPEKLEKKLKKYAQDGFEELAKNANFIFIPHSVAWGVTHEEFQRRIKRQCEPPRQ